MKGFFPVQCTTTLHKIGLLVKEARLRLSIRQVDLAEQADISLRTVRHIEAGNAEGVSLRDFMMALFTLGITDRVFQSLNEDPAFTSRFLDTAGDKRVRLPKSRSEDF
ncbi:helix-turn-helix transcriptional regulator [Pseudomonas indica]|uniref:helix-turn-helix transcriptional regulator n=1 Tax=Pseudomonas indica TaxID=137658 RepID=UPI0023F6D8DF|nr:helix-turn-helix domain-containing protein [Pseudomonas indica]MBU3058217.1 helix-turn-helix domain-containing protein [Pseudomonas indica]